MNATTTTFVVFRKGWNAANQSSTSGPETVEVWRGDADTGDAACNAARATGVETYNNQILFAETLASLGLDEAQVEATIQQWFENGADDEVAVSSFYRPNGGQATWSEESLPGHGSDEETGFSGEWETAELSADGKAVKVFRNDGPVLHFEEWRWVPAADKAALMIDTYCGEGCTLAFDDLSGFAEWLEVELSLERESAAWNKIVAVALRVVADGLES